MFKLGPLHRYLASFVIYISKILQGTIALAVCIMLIDEHIVSLSAKRVCCDDSSCTAGTIQYGTENFQCGIEILLLRGEWGSIHIYI